MLRPIELRCALLSHTGPPNELAHPNWATLHPTEQRWTLLSYAVPYCATLFSTELLSSLLSYAAPCELHYSLTELPSVLVPLCNFVKCRNVGLSGTGISVPQSGTRMLRYRTELLDAGIPMLAASASMPMPSLWWIRIQIQEQWNWLKIPVTNKPDFQSFKIASVPT